MAEQDVSLLERLRKTRNPREELDWEGRDGYYVAACRVSRDDVPGLIEIAGKWCDEDWLDGEGAPEDCEEADYDRAALLPVTAWRTLADLKAEAAVEPLLDMLRLVEEFDDWTAEELPVVFGKIGKAAIPALTRVAADASEQESVRIIAARGLEQIAGRHPSARDPIVAFLTDMMAKAAEDTVDFNSSLLVVLVDLRAVEAAEPIERAFAANLLDVGMMGDWEDVRRKLGVAGLGLKMPENPYNSMEQFRTRIGIGIFSDRPIFKNGELDEEVERAYYEQAWQTFSRSSEAEQYVASHGELGWFRMLLEFGIQYRGETVGGMKLASVQEFLLSHVPRKVSIDADGAATIVAELTAFWQYLDRVYKLPEAKSIVAGLKADDLVSRLKAELSDPSNFGLAKSMFVMGKAAGYDMTTEAGMKKFMRAYNESLGGNQLGHAAPPRLAEPVPTRRAQRVGRNDPCPCGSGRKFKQCCLRS